MTTKTVNVYNTQESTLCGFYGYRGKLEDFLELLAKKFIIFKKGANFADYYNTIDKTNQFWENSKDGIVFEDRYVFRCLDDDDVAVYLKDSLIEGKNNLVFPKLDEELLYDIHLMLDAYSVGLAGYHVIKL